MTADPYSWTAAEVADFFRNHAAASISDLPNRSFPDMTALAQVFEENSIAGFDLIDNAIDTNFLREECKISSFGMRRSIMNIIKRLQERHSPLATQVPVPETPRSLSTEPQAEIAAAGPIPSPTAEQVTNLEPIGENIRSAEHLVTDKTGRKRRKLAISKPMVIPAGYLPIKPIAVDEVFFGKTPLGHELGDLEPEGDIQNGSWDGSDYWAFQYPEKLTGEVDFVYKQMRHFLQNDVERPLKRRGRDAIAILPYRATLLPQRKCQSAFVFQMPPLQQPSDASDEEEALVMRENVAYLDEDVQYDGLEQGAATGEWDFLLRRRDEYPEYKAGSLVTVDTSYAKELDEDEEARAQEKKGLSEEEIEDTVKEWIDATASQWRDNKLPGLEVNKAWTVWKKMKSSKKIRDGLIGNASEQISILEKRLDKQSKQFLRDVWNRKSELVAVCKSMEATVEDRELCKWKIEVWHRKQEPFHVSRHATSASSKAKSSAPNPTPGLVIHPDDRLSLEPAPLIDSAGDDDQAFHTPRGSPEPVDGHVNDAGDEMDIDSEPDSPFVDPEEESPPELLDPPVVASRSNPSARSSFSDTSGLGKGVESGEEWPSTSSFVKSPPPKAEPKSIPVIDLCSDSATSTSSKKQKKKKITKKALEAAEKALEAEFAANPLDATIGQVRAWDMDKLISRSDRTRFLIKLLAEAGDTMRMDLQKSMTSLRRPGFIRELESAMLKLKANPKEMGGFVQENTMIASAKIYLAYFFLAPSMQHEIAAKEIDWSRPLHDRMARTNFVNILESILQKRESRLFVSPKPKKTATFLDVVALDSSSEEDALKKTPSKQRKQKLSERAIVKQSQAVQDVALRRQEAFKARQTQLSNSQDLATMVSGPSRSAIMINITKKDDEEPICVDKTIAAKIKDHQVTGVRFMWRELTAHGESGQAQGCILAHTMGLGKTMQTITVLVALNEAAQSEDPRVYKQLPKNLRRPRKEERELRILILCPPTLLNNWRSEIEAWARKRLPLVFVVDAKVNQKQIVNEWHEYGGVLLMGYENFQKKMPVDAKKQEKMPVDATKQKKAPKRVDEDLREKLLEGPDVVVADEAHKIKNEDTGITKSAQLFRTKTRIALTGTPMSNDVQEIYSLISWVAPKYLGDAAWFNANYAKPIKDGNGKESTQYQIRRGMKKLALLHLKIGPKVDRATIDVLKGSLGSKTEFHITLPLTATQKSAYSKYVKALLGEDGVETASQVAIFGWLALLTLLTNHPVLFKRKLLEPPKPKANRSKSREATPAGSDGSVTPLHEGGDDEEDEADAGARSLSFSKEVIDDIVADITDDGDHTLSAKMTVLMDIVRLSKACGDKLIIFTYSIATLDYLAGLFRKAGISFGRIDGKVLPPKRLPILEDFEKGAYDLMIVSTKAGGTGLNIQTANRVIILDAHFNPAYEEQAIGRSYRLGQTKPVFVYRFVSGGTFEFNIWNKQVFKTGMSLRVVDKKKTKRNADHNSKEYLYEPKDPKQADVLQYEGSDTSVLDHILSDSAGAGALIREIETTETLQAEVVEQLTEQEQREVDEEWLQERNGTATTITTKGKGPMAAPPPPSTAPLQGQGRFKVTMPAPRGHVHPAPTLMAKLPISQAQAAMMWPASGMPHGLPSGPSSTMPSRPN